MGPDNTYIPLVNAPRNRAHSGTSQRPPAGLITASEYVGAINLHATQSHDETLYPGQVYEDLSVFLRQAPALRRSGSIEPPTPACSHSHVNLYALDSKGTGPTETFDNVASCVKSLKRNTEQQVPQLLFLNGHTCPEWLTSLSSNLSTDPEFLNSCLLFRCRRRYSAYPALPSAYENNIRLRIVTIGSRRDVTGGNRSDSNVVEMLRSQSKKDMDAYHHQLRMDAAGCGDSIVRDFHVLSERHFLIEQEISICLHPRESSWIALVVSDIGNNLFDGLKGPWSGKKANIELYPTIQHRKRIALRTGSAQGRKPSLSDSIPSQTASLLARGYGNLLAKPVMSTDPFYALHDIFRFAASAENQLLNLLEDYVTQDTGHESLNNERLTLSNLVYYQEILETHLGRLRETKEVIQRRGGHRWPKSVSNKAHHTRAEAAAALLLEDFSHLEHRALSISKRCKRGMNIIMNNRMLAETKLGMSQAKRVTRLTFIAFIYIPLSFTTSFFGMNIQQLGSGGLPIWVWIATTVPVLVITILMFFMDIIARHVLRLQRTFMSRLAKVWELLMGKYHQKRKKRRRSSAGDVV